MRKHSVKLLGNSARAPSFSRRQAVAALAKSVMKHLSVLAAVAVATLALTASKDASAGPIELELGAKAGVGSNPSSSSLNPLGFGIGARGGVSIIGIYGGLNLMYYTGGSSDTNVVVGNVHTSAHSLMYGIEGGFNFRLLDDLLTLRPQLGLGNFNVSYDASGNAVGVTVSGNESKSYLYLEPSALAYLSFGNLFVGADIGFLVIPSVDERTGPTTTESKTWTSLTIHGQVGLKF